MVAETVNAGTKFIVRDIAQQQVGEHREIVYLVEIEARQRLTTQREKVWVSPLVRRSTVKRQLSHLDRSVLPGVVFFQANYLVSFSTPDLPWNAILGFPCTPQPRWISKWRLLGGARLIMAQLYPLTFDPQKAFLCMCSVCLVLKGEEGRSLNALLKQGFAPLYPCHGY